VIYIHDEGGSPKEQAHESEEFTMTNIYALRNHFELHEYKTAITRADFEAHFKATKEKVTFTFGGWDGISYHGESRTARVYRTDIKGYEDVRFIKVGKGLHYIEDDLPILEEATGETHPSAEWLVDVLKSAR
jgi:hypothetical protein